MKVLILSLLVAAAVAIPYRHKAARQDRIVGGEPAVLGQFPYQVSFQTINLINDRHFCGGSIYLENYVITAAHCVDGNEDDRFQVVAGIIDRGVLDNAQIIEVERVIKNTAFDSSNFANDIALLKLVSTFNFTANVQAVQLPSSSDVEAFSGNATVSGWGSQTSGGPLTIELRYVEVPILTDVDCRATRYEDDEIFDSMICAGAFGIDSCQGDSGGPLTAEKDGSKYLVGIVSWGYGCGAIRFPGVYTEVAYFIDWIVANLV